MVYSALKMTSEEYKWSWCADGADLGRGILIANGGRY
jgi:hypothetical protein